MYVEFQYHFILLALLFMVTAYAVGVKKQVWMLRGFRQSRIRDKDKLAVTAGYFFLNSGFFLLLNGLVHIPYQESFTPSAIIAYGVCTIIYVQKTLVD
ncbi:DUF3784 domain-containing protein [Bacillus sonorensis]|uniref:DUF3784 domain-containing protein n=1 Tax=Bacillus sonorensis TaxID=119858 RepID=UPI002DB99A38|nr:DUF3784 domain-containing protein [Bacillus sonorensis]MEC1352779.1 DUF3784 domain-containing protein [Bacillus sonorensis]MEC1426357.1 DUF3784 domain-containing protein [Bacillus sonorensis]